MKKFASGILFLAAIVLAVVLSGNIYAKKKTVFVNAWSNSSTIAGFYNEGRDSIDVLAVGSSTASNGIQPRPGE